MKAVWVLLTNGELRSIVSDVLPLLKDWIDGKASAEATLDKIIVLLSGRLLGE